MALAGLTCQFLRSNAAISSTPTAPKYTPASPGTRPSCDLCTFPNLDIPKVDNVLPHEPPQGTRELCQSNTPNESSCGWSEQGHSMSRAVDGQSRDTQWVALWMVRAGTPNESSCAWSEQGHPMSRAVDGQSRDTQWVELWMVRAGTLNESSCGWSEQTLQLWMVRAGTPNESSCGWSEQGHSMSRAVDGQSRDTQWVELWMVRAGTLNESSCGWSEQGHPMSLAVDGQSRTPNESSCGLIKSPGLFKPGVNQAVWPASKAIFRAGT